MYPTPIELFNFFGIIHMFTMFIWAYSIAVNPCPNMSKHDKVKVFISVTLPIYSTLLLVYSIPQLYAWHKKHIKFL